MSESSVDGTVNLHFNQPRGPGGFGDEPLALTVSNGRFHPHAIDFEVRTATGYRSRVQPTVQEASVLNAHIPYLNFGTAIKLRIGVEPSEQVDVSEARVRHG